MSFVPRREKVRKGFTSPNGLKLLSTAVGSAQKKNAKDKADHWTNTGKDASKDYREPMPSVTVKSPKKWTSGGNQYREPESSVTVKSPKKKDA